MQLKNLNSEGFETFGVYCSTAIHKKCVTLFSEGDSPGQMREGGGLALKAAPAEQEVETMGLPSAI